MSSPADPNQSRTFPTHRLNQLKPKLRSFFLLKEYRRYTLVLSLLFLLTLVISSILIAQEIKRRQQITPELSQAADNLIPNSSFEQDSNKDQIPDGWNTGYQSGVLGVDSKVL